MKLSGAKEEHFGSQPAVCALTREVQRETFDIDECRVVMIRDALKDGRIVFDAKKLSTLIMKFHGVCI